MKPKLLTVTQYAKENGISRQATLKRIQKKKVKSFRIGNFYLIGKRPKGLTVVSLPSDKYPF